MKQIINGTTESNWPNVEIEFHKPIELFIDNFYGYKNNGSFKILWVKEVEDISKFKEKAIENHKNFDILLSYDEEVLEKCNNSYFLPFGTTWIDNFDFSIPKKFQISHLTGYKEFTPFHILRKKVHYKQKRIKTPIDFYISKHGGVENVFNNKILGDFKNPLFESQFHICIENSQQKNLFTEKLIDCFITKTIPIHCGCKNIGDFFDIRGMFIVDNLKEIIDVSNSITHDTYKNMEKFVNINYESSKKFTDNKEMFKQKILEIIK